MKLGEGEFGFAATLLRPSSHRTNSVFCCQEDRRGRGYIGMVENGVTFNYISYWANS